MFAVNVDFPTPGLPTIPNKKLFDVPKSDSARTMASFCEIFFIVIKVSYQIFFGTVQN